MVVFRSRAWTAAYVFFTAYALFSIDIDALVGDKIFGSKHCCHKGRTTFNISVALSDQNTFLECFLHPFFGQFERISSSLQVSPSDWCRRAARVSTIHKSWLFLRSSRTGIAVCTTFVAVAFLVELIVHGIGCSADTSLS